MLHLLVDTGTPASELADIRLGDFDLEARILRVRGKCSQRQRVKWRTVSMGVRAQQAVERYALRRRPPAIPVGEARVFQTRDRGRMPRNTVHRSVKRLGRQAGVERTHPLGTCVGVVASPSGRARARRFRALIGRHVGSIAPGAPQIRRQPVRGP